MIDEATYHIYLVTYSTDGTNYYHRVHSLFNGLGSTTALTEDLTASLPNGVQISSGSTFAPQFQSFTHIQRPGLLLLPDTDSTTPKLYIGFSMMDGLTTTYPPGFAFMYYGDNLTHSGTPVVYTTEPNTTLGYGGGIWMDGAGLAAGLDSSGGSEYL